MDLGFHGEVADFYRRYRRGYPPAVIDHLVDAFALTDRDVVLDVGCGTGQVTLPLAERVDAAIGMDPEPDMLRHARSAALDRQTTNVNWLLGADTDVAGLRALFGQRKLGAVTIAQALHWMDHDSLFGALIPMIRARGGIAVVTNGKPLWQQDKPWSQALRGFLSDWLGSPLSYACGTDEESQLRYQSALEERGLTVQTTSIDYSDQLGLEQIVGGLYSAFPVDKFPTPEQRPEFMESVRRALSPHRPFVEDVRVAMLLGTLGETAG